MTSDRLRVHELGKNRGGRPGLSVPMSLTVSVDVKQHRTGQTVGFERMTDQTIIFSKCLRDFLVLSSICLPEHFFGGVTVCP